jgi:prophage tail gpP-like protein
VVIVDEALKTKKLAGARASREFAQRNRSLDRLTVSVDGLSYREGSELLPWAQDTTLDVVIEQLGGAIGNYYVEEVEMTRNASQSDISRLTLVRQGVWVL